MIERADISLIGHNRRVVGTLSIQCRPGQVAWKGQPALRILSRSELAESASAPVQLLEECEYAYSIQLPWGHQVDSLEPRELFDPSSNTWIEGRLRVARATGSVVVTLLLKDGSRATGEFEVRSRKLEYESEYRSMLRGIGSEATELLQSKFAASSFSGFRPDHESNPETLYQRFAFAKCTLESEDFENALLLIRNRPHHDYQPVVTRTDPSRLARPTRRLARELAAPRPRQPISGHPLFETVPRSIDHTTFMETYDTVPNRFVRFALERWRNLAREVRGALAHRTAADRRGQREARLLEDHLTLTLQTPALADAGRLTGFPGDNSVLHGRAGYREIMHSFLECEAAASVDWDGGASLFRAGQRDVATLYEYWVFLELVRIVESLPGFSVSRESLVQVTEKGLSLNLRRTGETLVRGHGHRRGRDIGIELWFNREFKGSADDSSWTQTLRPDCSLLIWPSPEEKQPETKTWIHFDAKYRINRLVEGFVDSEGANQGMASAVEDRPMGQDLMKMHTYRDAIRRTAGAYVLYPGKGTPPVSHRQYHEVLPGLGAFALRPAENGHADATSASAVRGFIHDVIDHVASRGTNSERANYWAGVSHRERRPARLEHHAALHKPAADTKVLLGFVKSSEHLAWIKENDLYNLRADDRRGSVALGSPELSADLLLLYLDQGGDTFLYELQGSLRIYSGTELTAMEYPSAGGKTYVCHELGDAIEAPMLGGAVRDLAARIARGSAMGVPRTVKWSQLLRG